jgi:hypothetical protein
MKIKNIEGLSGAQIYNMVNHVGEFVIFPYTVSIAVITFKRSSSIYCIKDGENTIKYSGKNASSNNINSFVNSNNSASQYNIPQ